MVGCSYSGPPSSNQGPCDPASLSCRLAGFFLPCASRPPDFCRLRLARPRRHYGDSAHAAQRAFVTTRAGTDTMARRHQDTEDEITEADNTAGDATFGGAVTPPSMSADLRTALAMPTTFSTALVMPTTLGPKLFEITPLLSGPPCMWIVMLSIVEWEHLTADQKDLRHTMRDSWLSSYSKPSHTVLQHWLWRSLKKQTQAFAPLHKVFCENQGRLA